MNKKSREYLEAEVAYLQTVLENLETVENLDTTPQGKAFLALKAKELTQVRNLYGAISADDPAAAVHLAEVQGREWQLQILLAGPEQAKKSRAMVDTRLRQAVEHLRSLGPKSPTGG